MARRKPKRRQNYRYQRSFYNSQGSPWLRPVFEILPFVRNDQPRRVERRSHRLRRVDYRALVAAHALRDRQRRIRETSQIRSSEPVRQSSVQNNALVRDLVCTTRKVRRAVLFARKLTGKGAGSRKRRFTWKSDVRC